MVSGRSKAYTDVPAKYDSTKDTSEFTAQVQVTNSRPAKFSECGDFLTEKGVAISVEELGDLLFDVEHGLQTPAFVENFKDKSLKEKRYVAVDIGGQDILSHTRVVLDCSGTAQSKTFTAYNPHNKTIETIVYCGQRNKLPTSTDTK